MSSLYPLTQYDHDRTREMLKEAETFRSLKAIESLRPTWRDQIYLALGDWMVASGQRLRGAATTRQLEHSHI